MIYDYGKRKTILLNKNDRFFTLKGGWCRLINKYRTENLNKYIFSALVVLNSSLTTHFDLWQKKNYFHP